MTRRGPALSSSQVISTSVRPRPWQTGRARGEAMADDNGADVVGPVDEPQLRHRDRPQLSDAAPPIDEAGEVRRRILDPGCRQALLDGDLLLALEVGGLNRGGRQGQAGHRVSIASPAVPTPPDAGPVDPTQSRSKCDPFDLNGRHYRAALLIRHESRAETEPRQNAEHTVSTASNTASNMAPSPVSCR